VGRTLGTGRRSNGGAHARRSRTALAALLAILAVGAAAIVFSPTSGQAAPSVEVVSAATTGTPETTVTVPGTSTPEPTRTPVPVPTATFARMAGTQLRIHFPAAPARFVAVGFHQADNKKAVRFIASYACLKRSSAVRTRRWLKASPKNVLFQQPLRGRGSSNFSAADCAVLPKTVVLAPVDGVVTSVRHYRLYGRIDDIRLEIKPNGYPKLRVVMLHITSIKVKKGARVVGGVTPVAIVRHLKLSSTINRYVPVKNVDHTHIQVNLSSYRGVY